MIPKDLLKKVRQIQIRTSHRVDDLLCGQYQSAFKGRGMEFEEVRSYQVGDDVRSIDWNVTARHGEPFIKLFREERELTAMLLVDLSASQRIGTEGQLKRQLVAEIGATLAFSAIRNGDKVGMIGFSDEIEKVIPARKGKKHVLRVIRELLYCEPVGCGTNIGRALEHLTRTQKRRAVVFLISDFQDQQYERAMRIAGRKHDIVPIVIGDRIESELPRVGLLPLQDVETGKTVLVDTSSRRVRKQYRLQTAKRDEALANAFGKLRMDPVRVHTGQDIVESLHQYFRRRERRGAR